MGDTVASTKGRPVGGHRLTVRRVNAKVLIFFTLPLAGPYRNWLPLTEPGGRPNRTEMRWQRRWPTATLASEYPALLGEHLPPAASFPTPSLLLGPPSWTRSGSWRGDWGS